MGKSVKVILGILVLAVIVFVAIFGGMSALDDAGKTTTQLSREDAMNRIIETDAEREKYYYQHTGKTWGDVSDYHIILDTSQWGIENCADVLMRYFERMQYI